ncbi:MAG: SH3 domain-containing protein, partial [Caldilineaceae bacterium]|nr:SH3 domain-containing protein [Caldilineaceae bacterium]
MNRSKTFHTFALLAVIILSTVGGVTFLGLQLAPLAGEIMGQGGMTVSSSRPSTTHADLSTEVVESQVADASLVATPALQVAARNSTTSKEDSGPALLSTELSADTKTSAAALGMEEMPDNAQDTTSVAIARIPTPAADAGMVAARTQQRAVVDASMVNVRSAPSLAGELLTQLAQNTELQILETSDDGAWYRVCCPLGTVVERETWVSAELLRLLPSPAEQLSAGLQAPLPTINAVADQAVAAAGQGEIMGRVNVALVNIRSGPSTQYEVVGQVAAESTLTIIGRTETGAWVQVCCPVAGAQPGWISAELLDILDDKEQALQVLPVPPIPPPPTASPPETANAPNRQGDATVAVGTGPGLPGPGGFGSPGATNPLTGQGLAGGRNGQRPVIVCINNDPAARPQWGLSQADIGYEYLMEGYGITRFSALFYGENVGQI